MSCQLIHSNLGNIGNNMYYGSVELAYEVLGRFWIMCMICGTGIDRYKACSNLKLLLSSHTHG